MRPPRTLLWILVILGALAGAFALLPRVRAERANRTVDLVLDYFGLVDYCETEGVAVPKALEMFKKAGVSALAYSENNLERLRTRGRLNYYPGLDFPRALRSHTELLPAGIKTVQNLPADATKVYVVVYDPPLLKELRVYLKLFLGSAPNTGAPVIAPSPSAEPVETAIPSLENPSPSPQASPAPYTPRFRTFPSDEAVHGQTDRPVTLEVDTSERGLQETSLGFSRADLAVARDAGMHIYLRPENRTQFGERDVKEYFFNLSKLKSYGVRGLIFAGGNNEILGYPDNLDTTVDAMRAQWLMFGNIEVPNVESAQKGSQTLGIKLADQTVRAMSFSPQLQAKLTPEDAVDKFLLGVRERNIRVLYLRFFATPQPGKTLLQTNLDYFQALHDALGSAHYEIGPAEPFPRIQPPLWALLLMSLGVAAAFLLVAQAFREIPSVYEILVLVVTPLLAAGASAVGRWALWAKLAALLGGLTFPALGLILVLPRLMRLEQTETSPARAMLRAAGWLLGITALSVLGGMLIAGLLAATPFMLSADQARGIKLIMLLPPFLVLWFYMTRLSPQRRSLAELLSTPVIYWQLAVLMILAAAGAFFIIRTGNAAPAAASDFEISLRQLLENILVARPRFKEFALGHPAWILMGLLAWEQRGRSWLWLLALCAAIGQADVVDTFCHAHTPYLISLLRVANGVWLGILFGFLAGVVALWMLWRGNRPVAVDTAPEGG